MIQHDSIAHKVTGDRLEAHSTFAAKPPYALTMVR